MKTAAYFFPLKGRNLLAVFVKILRYLQYFRIFGVSRAVPCGQMDRQTNRQSVRDRVTSVERNRLICKYTTVRYFQGVNFRSVGRYRAGPHGGRSSAANETLRGPVLCQDGSHPPVQGQTQTKLPLGTLHETPELQICTVIIKNLETNKYLSLTKGRS
jgi:hypothetical protein